MPIEKGGQEFHLTNPLTQATYAAGYAADCLSSLPEVGRSAVAKVCRDFNHLVWEVTNTTGCHVSQQIIYLFSLIIFYASTHFFSHRLILYFFSSTHFFPPWMVDANFIFILVFISSYFRSVWHPFGCFILRIVYFILCYLLSTHFHHVYPTL